MADKLCEGERKVSNPDTDKKGKPKPWESFGPNRDAAFSVMTKEIIEEAKKGQTGLDCPSLKCEAGGKQCNADVTDIDPQKCRYRGSRGKWTEGGKEELIYGFHCTCTSEAKTGQDKDPGTATVKCVCVP